MEKEIEPRGEVHLESSQPPEFDIVAAQLRSDAADTDSFFKVLALKLSEALGERAKVERSGGLLKRDRPISGVVLDLTSDGSGAVLCARRERDRVSCTVSRSVRGISLSTKQVPVSVWIEELVSALSEEAKRSEATWNALHSLLS